MNGIFFLKQFEKTSVCDVLPPILDLLGRPESRNLFKVSQLVSFTHVGITFEQRPALLVAVYKDTRDPQNSLEGPPYYSRAMTG